MTKNARDRSLGDGVYFAKEDYIGIPKRLAILIIDSVILLLLLITLFEFLGSSMDYPDRTSVQLSLIVIWLYSVALKRSRFRTLGYRIMKAKLVNLQGETPSMIMLTIRETLWILGPMNFFFDIVWCSIDSEKQSLRDRLSQIYVIRNSAEPIGTGEVHLTYHNALGYSYTYPAVSKRKLLNTETVSAVSLERATPAETGE